MYTFMYTFGKFCIKPLSREIRILKCKIKNFNLQDIIKIMLLHKLTLTDILSAVTQGMLV